MFYISLQKNTKFLIYTVLSQFQILVIYMFFFFRQICIPKKSGLTKNTFSNSVQLKQLFDWSHDDLIPFRKCAPGGKPQIQV